MTKIITNWTLAIVAMFMITACSTEVGIAEGVNISGAVTYTEGTAVGAIVSIAYGAAEATTSFDQVTVADANGNYHFDGLNDGDYFVDAVFTDANGLEFNSPGFVVTIGGADDKVAVNFNLK